MHDYDHSTCSSNINVARRTSHLGTQQELGVRTIRRIVYHSDNCAVIESIPRYLKRKG